MTVATPTAAGRLPAARTQRRAGGDGGRAWLVACAALFACGWGGNQFTPLLSMYRSANGWSAVVVDALLGTYVLGLAPALLVGGRISDRVGRRRVVASALVASVGGSTLLAARALPAVAAGRFASGIGVGLAMAAGTTWATELSTREGGPAGRGARRASLWLTAGFAAGAGVAGILAEWAPAPETLPYALHVLLATGVLVAVLARGSDTRPAPGSRTGGGLLPDSARHRRFATRLVPAAPWVFGAAGVAYAVLPQAMAHRMGHWSLLYATFLTVVTLGSGLLAQPLARRLDHPLRPAALRAATSIVAVGIVLAALSVAGTDPYLAVVAAVVLGAGYGIGLVAGLLEVQRLAPPEELASLTGIFYAFTYIGFLLPTAMAYAARWTAPGTELAVLAAVAAVSAAVLGGRGRPAPAPAPQGVVTSANAFAAHPPVRNSR